MDTRECPEKITLNLPPYHQAIVNNAMRSGRYGNFSEFYRECIEVNGKRRGFCPGEKSLSPRARPTDNNPSPQNDHICPQGEKQCLQA